MKTLRANDKVEALAKALGFKLTYWNYMWIAVPDDTSFKDELDRVDEKMKAIVRLLGGLRGLRFKERPDRSYTILCEHGYYDRVEAQLKELEELVEMEISIHKEN